MRPINFSKLFSFSFIATMKEPVVLYMVSIVNVEWPRDVTVFTINEGDPVKLFLDFMKRTEKNTRFYAYDRNYDYAIIRSWCHFNQNDPITPTFCDFISQHDRVLKSALLFKSKKVYLFDYIDDVVIHQNDIDCSINRAKGLAIALKKRLQWGRNKMTLAADAKAVWKEKI
ncbi:hypothetical protein [Bartonella massiliensis]|uniref:hypothetical protein n=1 Tax=Bartonella massiliensis TaxID=929795 RepID=UPI00115A94DB|nr:hypothetical protein [Bartonella massiliensis]